MNHLTRNDYASALRLLARLEAEALDPESFGRAAVALVGELVAADVITLSVCDVDADPRPLQPGSRQQAMALPLFAEGRTLVNLALLRRGQAFSGRDCERLQLLHPHLAFLYRQVRRLGGDAAAAPSPQAAARAEPAPVTLTRREAEVMHWLSFGKTDADIAAMLAVSPRTVHKHLEHIYVKLGVETRTAAVMRVHALGGGGERHQSAQGGRGPAKRLPSESDHV
jgi:DNA-binding CsgD family transcriptional regulator